MGLFYQLVCVLIAQGGTVWLCDWVISANWDVWRADQLQINFLVIKYTDKTCELKLKALVAEILHFLFLFWLGYFFKGLMPNKQNSPTINNILSGFLLLCLLVFLLLNSVFHACFQQIVWAHTHFSIYYSSSRLELSWWLSTGINPTVKKAVWVSINLHNRTALLIFTAPL